MVSVGAYQEFLRQERTKNSSKQNMLSKNMFGGKVLQKLLRIISMLHQSTNFMFKEIKNELKQKPKTLWQVILLRNGIAMIVSSNVMEKSQEFRRQKNFTIPIVCESLNAQRFVLGLLIICYLQEIVQRQHYHHQKMRALFVASLL